MKWFLFLLIFLLLPFKVFAQELQTPEQIQQYANDTMKNAVLIGEHIENFDTQITVNKDGTMEIKETILYDFGQLERHGIFRNIPYTKRNENNKRVDLSFNNFKVTDENGKKYKFEKSTEGEQIILKIGDANKTITGRHTYIISYTVRGGIGYFERQDEAYWNATGTQWDVPMATASASIILPADVKNAPTECFTGAYGATEINCTSYQTGNTIHFYSLDYVPDYQGLTVLVGFPKGTVAFLPPTEYVPFFERWYGKITLVLMGFTAVLWYVILPIYLVINYFFKGRDPEVGSALRAWYDPPKTSSKRSLTPAESGALIDEKVDRRDIFAIIVDLARRGHIKIEERAKKDFYLHKTNSKDKVKLAPFELELLDGLFPIGNETRLKDTKLYLVIGKVETMLYKGMVTDGFFPRNPKTIRTLYAVLGVFGLVTLNFVLAFVAFFFGRIMPRKTLLGARQAQVARGMKNFLSSQERQLEFQADKQMFFEKLLPFAVAFGVEKIWAKRFEEFNLKEPSWYKGYPGSHFNSVFLASSLSDSYRSFSSSSTPPSSSSSGFSGGSSGGGGGGGGGGSW